MTGIPFLLDPRTLPVPEPDYPIIPNRRKGRAATLNEIADASQAPAAQPSFGERLGVALAAAGRANTLDPNSDNFVEAFLSSALGTFSGVHQAKSQDAAMGPLLDEAIIAREQERRAQMQQDDIDMALKLAQAKAYDALGNERNARAMGTGTGGTDDVTGIAGRWRKAGRSDVADYILANPDAVRRAPGTFLRLPSETTDLDEPTKAAIRRADTADRTAGSEIITRGRDPLTAVQPSAQDSVLGALRRLVDPTYTEDSTLRAATQPTQPRRIPVVRSDDDLTDLTAGTATEEPVNLDELLGITPTDPLAAAVADYRASRAGGGTRVVAPAAPTRTTARATSGKFAPGTTSAPAPSRSAAAESELKATAAQFNPGSVPIGTADELLRDPSIQPPFTIDERREILRLAGYGTEAIDLVVPREHTRSPARR